MSFLPEWSIVVQFALASLILALIPGPDMMLSVGRTITQSKKAGIMCALGSATGFAIQVTAVALGLSALIFAAPHAFVLLKIVGAFYLLWFAFQALRKKPTLSFESTSSKSQSSKRNYLAGIGINLLNPKVILFNATFLPQFINANDPMATQKLLFLGLSYIPISFPITISVIFTAHKLTKTLKQNPLYLRFLDWLIAGTFTSFALHLLIVTKN
ncbi:LysE family translocator [Bartonella tribocorum]|uniref:Amino acid efflux protein n=1 Tax=Bartonella tribocorum (strain DSM 28219 / CCUG 45778 / CIP 105476 / IBS 506) TaxID=382640 RepID=A9IL47_BART1|nr:LysE family translocator [Bartonella tribocorum]CAK00525.1 amino acid efflux protein [Bartonella tribocorum CIP 105476]CDO47717.1 amino acid efflux protein, LysE family [Bartonella tribocorum]